MAVIEHNRLSLAEMTKKKSLSLQVFEDWSQKLPQWLNVTKKIIWGIFLFYALIICLVLELFVLKKRSEISHKTAY